MKDVLFCEKTQKKGVQKGVLFGVKKGVKKPLFLGFLGCFRPKNLERVFWPKVLPFFPSSPIRLILRENPQKVSKMTLFCRFDTTNGGILEKIASPLGSPQLFHPLVFFGFFCIFFCGFLKASPTNPTIYIYIYTYSKPSNDKLSWWTLSNKYA